MFIDHLQDSKETKELKEAKAKFKDIKEEKEEGEIVKVKEEFESKETEKIKKKKDKKEKKEKKEKDKNTGPMHITANGEPVPLDETKELDKNHPLWDEVCLYFLGSYVQLQYHVCLPYDCSELFNKNTIKCRDFNLGYEMRMYYYSIVIDILTNYIFSHHNFHSLLFQCKEKMRPMKKALKTLDNPNESLTQEEQITHTRRCLVQIGDHIERCLETIKDADSMREWKRYVLQYFILLVTLHCTTVNPHFFWDSYTEIPEMSQIYTQYPHEFCAIRVL